MIKEFDFDEAINGAHVVTKEGRSVTNFKYYPPTDLEDGFWGGDIYRALGFSSCHWERNGKIIIGVSEIDSGCFIGWEFDLAIEVLTDNEDANQIKIDQITDEIIRVWPNETHQKIVDVPLKQGLMAEIIAIIRRKLNEK